MAFPIKYHSQYTSVFWAGAAFYWNFRIFTRFSYKLWIFKINAPLSYNSLKAEYFFLSFFLLITGNKKNYFSLFQKHIWNEFIYAMQKKKISRANNTFRIPKSNSIVQRDFMPLLRFLLTHTIKNNFFVVVDMQTDYERHAIYWKLIKKSNFAWRQHVLTPLRVALDIYFSLDFHSMK